MDSVYLVVKWGRYWERRRWLFFDYKSVVKILDYGFVVKAIVLYYASIDYYVEKVD